MSSDTDYKTSRSATVPRSRSPATSATPWSWVYELRRPAARELAACAEAGAMQSQLLQAAAAIDDRVDWDGWCAALLAKGDAEAAAAGVFLGLRDVFEAGQDFVGFGRLDVHVERLLADARLTPIARAGLSLQRFVAELLGPGRLSLAAAQSDALGVAAENSGSDALRLLAASARAQCALMQGQLSIADALLSDAAYIDPAGARHPIPWLNLLATQALTNTVCRPAVEPPASLEQLPAGAAGDPLPNSLWLLCTGHRLMTCAVHGASASTLRDLADRLRARSVPEQRYYYRSYTHYALGAAALLSSNAQAALFHARTAIELGERCRSAVAQRTPALLAIQAMSDLGQYDEALALLDTHRSAWQDAGAGLLVASGWIEAAQTHLARGHEERARRALANARAALPRGERLPCNLRRPEQIAALVHRLEPELAGDAQPVDRQPPVQVETFGELRITIDGHRLYDRDWHGTRSKSLLKALITQGGYKVPTARLADMLWPDAEGDKAHNNLKVALSRLRRLGCRPGARPVPWIVVRHGCVSLVASLCRVDCIEFERALEAALGQCDAARVHAALQTLHVGFLEGDDSAAWIVAHRRRLARSFAHGARWLAQHAQVERPDFDIESVLEAALQFVPDEPACASLLAAVRAGTGHDMAAPRHVGWGGSAVQRPAVHSTSAAVALPSMDELQ